jgi:hypothetical protein
MRDVVRAVVTGGPGAVERSEIRALLSRYQGLNERYDGVIRAWTELTGPADSPMHDRGTAAVRAMFDETAAVLRRTRTPVTSDVSERDLQTRAALLFLLIERSSFYVSNRVSRIDPQRLPPTLATLVERAYIAAPS